MAAGFVTKTVGDGNGGTIAMRFWAADTSSGPFYPAPVPGEGSSKVVTLSVTRPANVTAYTANDAWANSTSAPTAGGFVLAGAGRENGLGGLITDIYIMSTACPATKLQGRLWIFDAAVTAVNDADPLTVSDADGLKTVAPSLDFTLEAGPGSNYSFAHLTNLNIGFEPAGDGNSPLTNADDLFVLIEVVNAYTPASAEVLSIRAKIQRTA